MPMPTLTSQNTETPMKSEFGRTVRGFFLRTEKVPLFSDSDGGKGDLSGPGIAAQRVGQSAWPVLPVGFKLIY
jgi:hypothetical protein